MQILMMVGWATAGHGGSLALRETFFLTLVSHCCRYTTQVYVSPRACQNYWSSNWVYVTSRMMCAGEPGSSRSAQP